MESESCIMPLRSNCRVCERTRKQTSWYRICPSFQVISRSLSLVRGLGKKALYRANF